MSRIPPSFSGGLLCADAASADIASAQAKAPATMRFMNASLDIFLPSCWRLRVGAIMPHAQGGSKPRSGAGPSCARSPIPLSGMDCAAGFGASSFETRLTPLLKMRSSRRTSRQTLMVRSRNAASRTMRPPASTQEPLARHVVDLQANTIGILEQHRIVAGRPLVLARRADDPGADRGKESVQLVDTGALACAETEVMQPDTVLVEGGTGIFRRWRADRHRGAAADAVIHLVGIDHRFQTEERQQLAIELAGALEIRRGQKDVRDAVDLHRLPLERDFG